MSKNKNKKKQDYGSLIGVGILILNLIIVGLLWKYIFNEDSKKQQAYLAEREDGIETYALVVDKESRHYSSGRSSSTSFYVTLRSQKETFEREIPGIVYGQIQQGDFVEVVIKGETIYFGKKDDEEETIRYIEKEKIPEEESSSSEAL